MVEKIFWRKLGGLLSITLFRILWLIIKIDNIPLSKGYYPWE